MHVLAFQKLFAAQLRTHGCQVVHYYVAKTKQCAFVLSVDRN